MDKIAPFPTAEAAHQKSVMLRMAQRFEMEPRTFEQTLMATIIPGGKATKEQVAAFLVVADRYNLDPFVKEIYAFPDKGGGVRPIVSVDGWLTLINRQAQHDGLECEELFAEDGSGKVVAITCNIYRKDRAHPTRITEYMAECARGTEPWRQWPLRILRHKAIIQCARVAFGLGGIFDPDEAERIEEAEEAREVEATVKPPAPKPKPTSLEDLIPNIVGMPPKEVTTEPEARSVESTDPGDAFAGWTAGPEDPA